MYLTLQSKFIRDATLYKFNRASLGIIRYPFYPRAHGQHLFSSHPPRSPACTRSVSNHRKLEVQLNAMRSTGARTLNISTQRRDRNPGLRIAL